MPNNRHFEDFFETGAPNAPKPPAAMTATEQIFWRIVRADARMSLMAEELKRQGQFEAVRSATANYMYYRFQRNGQNKSVGAEITPAAQPQQIRNFLESAKKAVSGVIEYANITPYLPIHRRP